MERCYRHPRYPSLPSALLKDVTLSCPTAVKKHIQQFLCASLLM